MASTMIIVRATVAIEPISLKLIILPPIFISSWALMFMFPVFRLTLLEVSEAVIVGILCSLLLIKFTKFEIEDGEIYLIPSKAFIVILVTLLVVRIIFKLIIGSFISFVAMSGMFF